MGIDLSQFHQVFFEESIEGLDVMESALMELDPSNIDSETINAIFRAAHSIKGGSATFGFTSISEFTHDLETILDQVRSGNREVKGEDINLYLQSVDCMREMLALLQAGEDGNTELSAQLKSQFTKMLNGESLDIEEENQEPAAVQPTDTASTLWHITFNPAPDLFRTGNDPFRIIRELDDLGEIKESNCQIDLPDLTSMEPDVCYMSWALVLEANCTTDDINDVFEWVEDDAEIHIEPVNNTDKTRWKIAFGPDKEILRTGNEPVRLFSALEEIGEIESVQVDLSKLPSLVDIEPEQCFLSWVIHFSSDDATEELIEEVFEWVVDESDFKISKLSEQAKEETSEPQATDLSATQADTVKPASLSNVAKPPSNVHPIPVKSQAPQPAASTPSSSSKKPAGETSSIRVGIDKVDNLINMVGELVITQSMLGQLGNDFDLNKLPQLLEGLSQLEQNTRELQESVMQIRMLPISFAFSRFPRMVRDLGQSLGKSVNLQMFGEQTELDKTVMEKIGDPLVHLVRNAVDHGIESPQERLAKGKSETGTITLDAYHQSGNVVIEIIDDGKGLDRDKIISKAIEKGIISDNEAEYLSNEQAYDLIFQPGFSTATVVSDVSGRGVGMDVVKKNIQSLNGVVELTSEPNKGSKITIRLPLTLAILDGQLIRVGKNTYIFPLVSIVESLQCRKEFISKVAGGCNVFRLRDDYVPIIELSKTFSVKADSEDFEESLMVVVESDGEKVGIVVDELLAQQQVVIKSLEQNYRRVDGISGATILGDGTVALILDIPGIVKLAGDAYRKAQQYTNSMIAQNNAMLTGSGRALG
ncbi:chemotaxis protein CheA [Teredinibacter sp. KSP-S5-2]|uniref:chemotaxis protein CheA n=1 Tax=Teredinibacter sp. KSP-S5-2 TaxID=3034506 RepID=UPI002934B546|nr:chemotaxis protein CheA [Teredinibacter sp. KSP-S5-2]WNO07915.1 chemotaxis protein CheA [Teredinibacter sp. KSP-S5-2]